MNNVCATTLALLLVFANVPCVCAMPVDRGGDAHAHHGQPQSGMDKASDCSRQDCDGECGDTLARSIDRDGFVKAIQAFADQEEPDFVETTVQWSRLEVDSRLAYPPPDPLHLASRTPVNRKDLLLE